VKAWAGGVSDALGNGGLDLLINNAGILTPGPLEVLPLDAIRHEFDVNVFGALSVMNAFLPALRKARGASFRSALGPPACRSVQRTVGCIEGCGGGCLRRSTARAKRFGIDVVVAAQATEKPAARENGAALKRVAAE